MSSSCPFERGMQHVSGEKLPAVAFVFVEEDVAIGHGGPGRDRGCAEGWRDGCVVDEVEPAVPRCSAEQEEHCIHQRAVLMGVECGIRA